MKTIELGKLFTVDELKRAASIFATETWAHQRIVDEIVTPKMAHINAVTGQENDAGYIAYALEYALRKGGK